MATYQYNPQVLSRLRVTNATNTATSVKTGQGLVWGVNAYNPNAASAFIKFYDAVGSTVTVGSTTPIAVIQVSATGFTDFYPNANPMMSFTNGLSFAVVTTASDSGSTALGSTVTVNIQYN